MVREKATFTWQRTCAVGKRTDYWTATGNPLPHGSVTTPLMWDCSVVRAWCMCVRWRGRERGRERGERGEEGEGERESKREKGRCLMYMHLSTLSAARYFTSTTTSATTSSIAPPSFPSLYIYIIAVSAFLLVVGFVIVVCCCACCVRKQKKCKKEGTWVSPNQRNGKTVCSQSIGCRDYVF